jgi:hypothetical protein
MITGIGTPSNHSKTPRAIVTSSHFRIEEENASAIRSFRRETRNSHRAACGSGTSAVVAGMLDVHE